jgi:hypothetical protein
MARPRKYSETTPATPAQRQAAKRARDREQWVEVSRDAHDAHFETVTREPAPPNEERKE